MNYFDKSHNGFNNILELEISYGMTKRYEDMELNWTHCFQLMVESKKSDLENKQLDELVKSCLKREPQHKRQLLPY